MQLATPRSVPVKSHPLVRKNYVLPTPSIDGFYERVRKCITYGMPGSMLYGHPRFGKTHAIRYVRNMLAAEFPQIVALSFLCWDTAGRSENSFFSHFLQTAGHAQAHTGSNSRKRWRLHNKLLEQVERSGEDLLILFADEAQHLSIHEYEWLRDVYNELELVGIRLLVFLIGQPDLRNQKSALQESRQTQIVGRFMTHEIPFRGLLSVHDVATCLAGYDESCFPPNSDWTYTRFFLPHAYKAGFRLVSEATALWEAFQEAHDAARFTFELELPMQYFTLAVELLLMQNAQHDRSEHRISAAMWREAVLESNYVSALESLWSRLPDGLD